MEKENVLELLKEGLTEILFKKVDGTERLMLATTNEKFLPKVELNEETPKKERKVLDENIIRCYSIDAMSWRSFKLENLVSIKKWGKNEK